MGKSKRVGRRTKRSLSSGRHFEAMPLNTCNVVDDRAAPQPIAGCWLGRLCVAYTPMIADACGRRVRLLDGQLLYTADSRTATLTDEQRDIAKGVMKKGRVSAIAIVALIALLAVPVVVFLATFTASSARVPGVSEFSLLIRRSVLSCALVLAAVLFVFRLYPTIRGWHPNNVLKAARKLADAYVCPCCGGTLMNVEADEKGNRTCSSCQSTWQTDFPKVA